MNNIEIVPNEVQIIEIDSFNFKVLGDETNHFYMTLAEAKEVFEAKADSIHKVIRRNNEDFEIGIDYITGDMLSLASLAKLDITPNNANKVKLLSKSGIVLIGMFLKSQKAKEFRRVAKHIIVKALENSNEVQSFNDQMSSLLVSNEKTINYLVDANYSKDLQISKLESELEKALTKKSYNVITPLEHKQIKEMFENNFSIPMIERELDLTRNQVEQSLKKQGIYLSNTNNNPNNINNFLVVINKNFYHAQSVNFYKVF